MRKADNSRAPRGARGLKFPGGLFDWLNSRSCPSRGTWIEIIRATYGVLPGSGRAPRGARGLKLLLPVQTPLLLPVVPLAGHVD